MSPIIVDKENKKREILEAAIRVFARLGIPNTNMIDVAREAGIGKGTIYEYFRSKEEIINETFRNFLVKIDTVDHQSLAPIGNSIEKLLFIIDGWMDALISSPDELKVIVEFWADGARLHNTERMNVLSELSINYRGFLESIIIEGIDKGMIRKLDAKNMATLIAGELDGIMLHWILKPDLLDLETALELYKENLVLVLKPD
jgi:TetR/AcrR family fatty acid metabolism transcriptional regulator